MTELFIDRIKTVLYGIKPLLMPLYSPYKAWRKKEINKRFLKNGLKTLECLDNCLSSNHISYMLGFGTLLGAVREHGFIKHDMDIDLCMWYDEYINKNVKICLEKAGFRCAFSKVVDDGKSGMEITFYYSEIRVDIFMVYPPVNELPYTCNLWRPFGDTVTRYESMKKYGKLVPYRLELPYNRETIRVDFAGLELPIPVNYKEILCKRYGLNYMTPDPNWKEPIDTFVCWDSKSAILITY